MGPGYCIVQNGMGHGYNMTRCQGSGTPTADCGGGSPRPQVNLGAPVASSLPYWAWYRSKHYPMTRKWVNCGSTVVWRSTVLHSEADKQNGLRNRLGPRDKLRLSGPPLLDLMDLPLLVLLSSP